MAHALLACLLAACLLGLAPLAAAAPCDNGANAGGCLLPPDRAIGPVNPTGDASCASSGNACGRDGFGPTSVTGDTACTSAGDHSCGDTGAGALSVAGSASCSNSGGTDSCGSIGVGALSVTGDASCQTTAYSSCGSLGIGAFSVAGDASCTGPCGSPNGAAGLGAVSVLGHAHCNRPLPGTNPTDARCVGGADVLEALTVGVLPQCMDGADNDGDGRADFRPPALGGADPECSNPLDSDEGN
jgi:hypothetical protein